MDKDGKVIKSFRGEELIDEIENYFNNVTKEQFEKDLKEANVWQYTIEIEGEDNNGEK